MPEGGNRYEENMHEENMHDVRAVFDTNWM